ncbi:MAG: hypothetical protein ACXVFO_04865, partial [Solirubrobacteraceae bacterium]
SAGSTSLSRNPDALTAQAPGNGVRGMRERAAALGGMLEAGPTDGGGWRVHAWLPMSEPAMRGSTALVSTEGKGGELQR